MSSTSERGHARNVANANLLNTYIAQLGATYNPSNPKIALSNLQSIYTAALAQQETVNSTLAAYTNAVNTREAVFAPVSTKITKLRRVFKATDGVTKAQDDDFLTISRKIKGERKTRKPANQTPEEAQLTYSTSQMSYDQRTNNYDQLISLLQSTPNYNPNEVEYQIATLEAEKTQMFQATQSVANTYVPLNNARSQRNALMYLDSDNLVDTFVKAKDYLFTILDRNSAQYKAISKISFRKV